MEIRVTLILIALVSSLIITLPNVKSVRAQETIVINSDGSIQGTTGKILRDGDIYTLTDNFNGTITVKKNSTIIDGARYALQGNGQHSGIGIRLSAYNSTVMNFNIRDYTVGIECSPYCYNSFMGNIIEGCYSGIHILGGYSNIIQYNTFRNNFHSISLVYCSGNNVITKNNIIVYSNDAMWVWLSQESTVDENYWSMYFGADADDYGIGDTSHVFREVNLKSFTDNHPLMTPVDINVIPEFPSWTPLLIMLVAVMVVAVIYKRRLRPQTN